MSAEVEFDASSHTYTVDDEEVPSVTTITDIISKGNALMWWAVNSARDYIMNEMEAGRKYDEVEIEELAKEARLAHRRSSGSAKKIGKLVHQFAEDWVNWKMDMENRERPDFPVNDQANKSVDKFLNWQDRDVEWLASEEIVYHPRVRYAGTYDARAKLFGGQYIIDFKTSKDIYSEYLLQATAYKQAYEIQNDESLDGIIIARFPKDGGDFETQRIDDPDLLDRHWIAFQNALSLWRWKQDMGG